ncbi:hypothetical protein UY3_16689 [Chelonia mydas]|uniref:Uncharacterized protein n=1 Tax=Chelonia mydas TaxID=8469 RepID=M7ATH4_CHEMY|nr:hypothetical protein UY3_16689 [Chelonia mydas]
MSSSCNAAVCYPSGQVPAMCFGKGLQSMGGRVCQHAVLMLDPQEEITEEQEVRMDKEITRKANISSSCPDEAATPSPPSLVDDF